MRKLLLKFSKLSKFFNMDKEFKVIKLFHKVFKYLLEVKVMMFW